MGTAQSAIIRCFTRKSQFFILLGVRRLKRIVLVALICGLASISFIACGYSSSNYKPPSGINTRVFVSQSITGPTSGAGLIIIDGSNDTLARASGISAGSSPGLMAISPERSTLLVFDSATNNVEVVNSRTETLTETVQFPRPPITLAAPTPTLAY